MDTLQKAFTDHVARLGLPEAVGNDYNTIYLPVLQWIESNRSEGTPFILGINGAQGSGKSTFCALMQVVLETKGYVTAVLSIDDLYHTRLTRKEMAETIHPLCAIRGVPGTHDVEMGLEILEQLKTPQLNTSVALPRFDKAMDDRCCPADFDSIKTPVDVVLFEGWCVGEPPIPAYTGPFNAREERDDPSGVWSRWSEAALNTRYQALNAKLDALLMIKVPSLDVVRSSRWRQEQKLVEHMKKVHGNQNLPGLMTHEEVIDYVALFERHTDHMFHVLVQQCDILIERDKDFHYTLARY